MSEKQPSNDVKLPVKNGISPPKPGSEGDERLRLLRIVARPDANGRRLPVLVVDLIP